MNLKQLGILLVLMIVLGGAGLVLYRNQSASWKGSSAGMGQKPLADLPVNDVAHISIAQGTNRLNLIRKSDLWRVEERGDYPANYSQIRDFLLKAQALKVVQSEQVKPLELAKLGLAPAGQGTNAPLVVEFKDQKDKVIRTLWLGKSHTRKSGHPSPFGEEDLGWPDGRYVKVGDADRVAVVSEPLENIEPKPENWLNKDFIRIDKARTVEVDCPNPTNSWKLTRETESGEWKLAEAKTGEQLDSSKTSSMSYPLSSPSFSDVLPGATLGGTGTNAPTVLKVSTFDNFNYTVHVGQKTNGDEYPVTVSLAADIPKSRTPGPNEKTEDKARLDKEFKEKQQTLEDKLKQEQACENWTYLVSTWTLDPLLKERSQLLMEPKAASKKNGTAAGEAAGETNPSDLDNNSAAHAQTSAAATLNPATNSVPAGTP